jgi:hypothetical protein
MTTQYVITITSFSDHPTDYNVLISKANVEAVSNQTEQYMYQHHMSHKSLDPQS